MSVTKNKGKCLCFREREAKGIAFLLSHNNKWTSLTSFNMWRMEYYWLLFRANLLFLYFYVLLGFIIGRVFSCLFWGVFLVENYKIYFILLENTRRSLNQSWQTYFSSINWIAWFIQICRQQTFLWVVIFDAIYEMFLLKYEHFQMQNKYIFDWLSEFCRETFIEQVMSFCVFNVIWWTPLFPLFKNCLAFPRTKMLWLELQF